MQHFIVTYVDENRHQIGQDVAMARASLKEVVPENLDIVLGGKWMTMATRREVTGTDNGNPPITRVLVHCTPLVPN